MKLLIAGVAAFGAALLLKAGAKTYNTAQVLKDMQVDVVPRESNGKALVAVTIKNPVSESIRIKYPSVRLSCGGSVISSSDPKPDVITIPANGKVTFNLETELNWLQLALTLPSVGLAYKAGKGVALDMVVYSGLVTSLGTAEWSRPSVWKIL